jgi:hypothetical protein
MQFIHGPSGLYDTRSIRALIAAAEGRLRALEGKPSRMALTPERCGCTRLANISLISPNEKNCIEE